jgi:ureidoglycolate hydrolase
MQSPKKAPSHLLSAMDFAGYGQVIAIPHPKERKPDFQSEVISFYGALGVLDTKVPVEFGICVYRKRELVVEELEQHLDTQELLYAIDDDFIVAAAPNPVHGPTNLPDLEKLVGVIIRRGEGVLFHRGIWHSVPYPYKKESFALVCFAKGTAGGDMHMFKLGEKLMLQARQTVRHAAGSSLAFRRTAR